MKDGKLFGKINVIDLLVILLVVAVGALFVVRTVQRRGISLGSGTTGLRIEYVVKVSRVDPEVVENAREHFNNGETQLVANERLIDGKVTDMRVADYVDIFGNETGEAVKSVDPYYRTLYFTVQAPITNAALNMAVSQEIRVGKANCVKTSGLEFTGTIVDWKMLN